MTYLENKNCFPVKTLSNGRLSYLCPLPWHKETKPSFVVWTNAEFENFYCFGCNFRYNIIHLVSALESISVRQAIEKLSDGVEISIVDETELTEREFKEHFKDPNQGEVFSEVLLEISDICKAYLQSVDYDVKESEIIDKLWQIVDNSLRDYEFDVIEKVRKEIGGLILRRKNLLQVEDVEKIKKGVQKP